MRECIKCKIEIAETTNKKYCEPCRHEREKERKREYYSRIKVVREKINCDRCDIEMDFHSNKKVCKDCAEINRKEYMKAYKQIPEVKAKHNKRESNSIVKRYKEDIFFRIGHNISVGMRKNLRRNNLSKNRRHWENLVNYSSADLKQHLENQFVDGMTWKNQGKWHIDHIIPKDFFEIKEVGDTEFRMCWRLENLQPLWAFDNLSKHNNIARSL